MVPATNQGSGVRISPGAPINSFGSSYLVDPQSDCEASKPGGGGTFNYLIFSQVLGSVVTQTATFPVLKKRRLGKNKPHRAPSARVCNKMIDTALASRGGPLQIQTQPNGPLRAKAISRSAASDTAAYGRFWCSRPKRAPVCQVLLDGWRLASTSVVTRATTPASRMRLF
jgi:hypothetical protein